MKRITRLAALISLTCLASSVQQAHADTSRLYLGADIGSAQLSGNDSVEDSVFVPGQKFSASDAAYGLHLGFQFTDWFALELGYNDFGDGTDRFRLRDDIVFITQPNDTLRLDARGASLAGVFSYALSPRFALLAVAGISAMDYTLTQSGGFSSITGNLVEKDSLSNQGLVLGVGAKYAFNDSISLRTEFRRHNVGDFTLDITSLGLEYAF